MYNVKQPTEEGTHTRPVMDVRVSTSIDWEVTLDSIRLKRMKIYEGLRDHSHFPIFHAHS